MKLSYQNPQDMSIQELINNIARLDAEIAFTEAQMKAYADEEDDEIEEEETDDWDNEYFEADSYEDVRERNPSLFQSY